MIIVWVLIGIFLLFGLTVFVGAPYVPAHRKDVIAALDLLDLKRGDTIIDLGSGDGVLLKAAAERGLIAYGYEINPLLCIVARVRCRHYRKQVKVLWRDFWLTELPVETKAVFIFAAGPFMKRLARKFEQESRRRKISFYVASYGFNLPGNTPIKQSRGMFVYHYGKRGEEIK